MPGLPSPQFVLAWGTLRNASFPDRVSAAARSGYSAIGMTVADYDRLRGAGWSDADLLRVLDAHDMRIDEVEVLYGFFADPGPAHVPGRPGMEYASAHVEGTAFHMADVFGVRRLQVVGTFDQRPVTPRTADRFGELCDRAAPHDLQVVVEAVPYTNIGRLRVAANIVAQAARPNGGLCLDTWHFFREGAPWSDLERLEPGLVGVVQFNDGSIPPNSGDPATDAVHGRLLPGQGDFDLVRLVSTMLARGVAVPISVEIYSDDLDRLPSSVAAERAVGASREVFRAAAVRLESQE